MEISADDKSLVTGSNDRSVCHIDLSKIGFDEESFKNAHLSTKELVFTYGAIHRGSKLMN